MHWYCLFIDDKPAAGWHRHRRDAMRDAMVSGAASASGKRVVWIESARIEVCNNAHDRDMWVKLVNAPSPSQIP